jgi:hypothetical protein
MADIASLINGNAVNIKLSSEYLNHLKKLANGFTENHLIDLVTKVRNSDQQFIHLYILLRLVIVQGAAKRVLQLQQPRH